MSMRVFVTRQLPGPALEQIRKLGWQLEVWPEFMPPGPQTLKEKVRGVDGLIPTVDDRIDQEVMEAAGPGLKVVAAYAVGVNNVDLQAARARGIRVTNTPGTNMEATADLAFSLLCAVARRIVEGADYVRRGVWKTWHPELLLGSELYGSTLGIVGFGAIGQAMARRARGFSMRVLYHSRTKSPSLNDLGQETSLESLLVQSDFVSIHTPLTPETHQLFNRARLLSMKKGAILINTARGPIVDTQALLEVLEAGHLGGAGLDVTDPEPLPAEHPLIYLSNVVVIPHIGSAGRQTRERMAEVAVGNLIAVLQGREAPNKVV
jgi:glyoxylate reductase